MKSIKQKVFATILLFTTIAGEVYAQQNIAKYLEQAIEDKVATSLWKHFDFSRKNLYLRIDGGWRKYSSRITGFTKHPKMSNVFGYGIGYRFKDYPMRLELNVQKNNFKIEEGTAALKNHAQIMSINLYRDMALPIGSHASKEPFKRLKCYVTAGAGLVQYTHSRIYGTKTTFTHHIIPYVLQLPNTHSHTYNLGVGLTLKLSSKFSLDLSYKYTDLGRLTFDTNKHTVRTKSSQVSSGLLLSF